MLLPTLHLAAAALNIWRPETAWLVAQDFAEEHNEWKCWTLYRELCSVFAEDGENSSGGSRGQSRFRLPGSGDGDAFQKSVFQHNFHVLASWQPALWKGICVTVWTWSFQIPALLCIALWTQYTQVGVHTDQRLLNISSGASISLYRQVTWIWPGLCQQGRFCKLWGQ